MVDASLSRGNTSVTFDLIQEADNLAIGRDVGKPNANYYETGQENPKHQDNFSSTDQFTVGGFLRGSNAYSDAKKLAEQIIKPRLSTDTPLTLDLSNVTGRSTYSTVPQASDSLTLEYLPGQKNWVLVGLKLSVIDSVIGGNQSSTSNLTPDSGDKLKLKRNSTEVKLSTDVRVTRSVGRPGIKLQPRSTELPNAVDINKPATDTFDLSAELISDTAATDAVTLEETIFRPQLSNNFIELHFQSNYLGLDAYRVAPDGSGALRTTSDAATTNISIPSIALRVINP